MTAYSSPIGPAWQDSNGYWCIWIPGKNGKRGQRRFLHRLIYEQAHGLIPPGCVIHHLDGDPSNCSLANLRCLPLGKHTSQHRLGLRPSQVVLSDGTVAKLCNICDEYKPLKELVPYKTPAGPRAYRPYCKECYYWTYGWGKRLLAAQAHSP